MTGFEKLSAMESWMLDSGPSCHMAGNASMMEKAEKIAPVAIGLLNGTYTMAHDKGSVVLGKGLEVDNVLSVPKLKCNLVSISKLCKQLNYAMKFFNKSCVIQDHTSRTLIGSGEQRGEVYYYRELLLRQVNAVDVRGSWHRLLGIRLEKYCLFFLTI